MLRAKIRNYKIEKFYRNRDTWKNGRFVARRVIFVLSIESLKVLGTFQ